MHRKYPRENSLIYHKDTGVASEQALHCAVSEVTFCTWGYLDENVSRAWSLWNAVARFRKISCPGSDSKNGSASNRTGTMHNQIT